MIQHFPVLSVISLFLGSFLVVIFGGKSRYVRNGLTLLFSTIPLLLICALIRPVLIEGEIISYWLGGWEPVSGYAIGIGLEIDALSLFFALIVVLTIFLAAVFSMKYMSRDDAQDKYYTLFLMLGGGVLGLVLSGDLFNMFIMVEILTFASVALTAFRNWSKGALEAAFKYLVVGSIGSSFILAGTIMVYAQVHTLSLAQISATLTADGLTPATIFGFALLFAGYGVKAYIVPFHPVAADAYMTAPASISMVFSGMVNKAGVYGLIRLVYLVFQSMDRSAMQYIIVIMGTLTMFIGVTMALSQHDFKRLLAYHSISQIGYVLTAVGLATALGISGGLYHALNHTLFKGLLFLCAGAVFYSVGTTDLDKLGGLAKKMPQTTAIFLIGAFSISGLPPFNGFMSKWMIYQAAYEKAAMTGSFFYAIVTVVGLLVSVLTLASFIKVTQSVFFGQLAPCCEKAKEVPFSMRLPMWIMAILCLLTGVLPALVNRFLIVPATSATLNSVGYIDAMMGSGYAENMGVSLSSSLPLEYHLPGYWDPIIWLILFLVILTAVMIAAGLGKGSRGPVSEPVAADPKYATFFGGEQSQHSHVGGSDLFWGLKHNLRHYFSFMHGMHSGVVNDYALWTVVATALIILFMIVCL